MPDLKQFLQKFYVGPICSTAAEEIFPLNVKLLLSETKNNVHSRTENAAKENLINKDADRPNIELLLKTKNNVHSTADPFNNNTLLLKTKNNVISKAEQQLCYSFEKVDIYEFLTGEKDCIP